MPASLVTSGTLPSKKCFWKSHPQNSSFHQTMKQTSKLCITVTPCQKATWLAASPHKGRVMRKGNPWSFLFLYLNTAVAVRLQQHGGSRLVVRQHLAQECKHLWGKGTNWYTVKTSKIRHNKCWKLNVSPLVLQFALPDSFKPGVKSRMKM